MGTTGVMGPGEKQEWWLLTSLVLLTTANLSWKSGLDWALERSLAVVVVGGPNC
jgi:hypothetical protein